MLLGTHDIRLVPFVKLFLSSVQCLGCVARSCPFLGASDIDGDSPCVYYCLRAPASISANKRTATESFAECHVGIAGEVDAFVRG